MSSVGIIEHQDDEVLNRSLGKAANIPVYLCYFDWGRKKVAVDQKFELTDDANADTRRIQEIYESMNLKGRHPEKYLTR